MNKNINIAVVCAKIVKEQHNATCSHYAIKTKLTNDNCEFKSEFVANLNLQLSLSLD